MRRPFRLLAQSRTLSRTCLLALSGFSLLLAACAEKSPEEIIEAQRQLYSAELTNFVVMQEPEPEPVATEEADEEAGEGAGDATDGDAMDAMEPEPMGPVTRNVLLDILVQNTGSESLPGITVDVSQIDSNRNPKGDWKLFLELPSLAHGTSEQVSQVLEDVDFEEGDGFAVQVRSPIPAAEQGDYAEFQ